MISFLDKDFSQLNYFLNTAKPSKLLILVDENTHERCLPLFLGNMETDIPFEIIEIEPGEELKNIATATQLWEILSEFETDRKALMINLGGGVITDLGGFVSSTYKRGIRFVNVPTTLLAMVDASIGGKTGIDHQFLKNIVGTFAHAEKVLVSTDFLKTLPFEELRSGFAEMLKHGLIADEKHWNDLISIDDLTADHIAPYIEQSMKIKENVVEKDFKEQNVRKTLNFGHTIGHAFESLFLENNAPVLHGEAVAAGMICETYLSLYEGLLPEKTAQTVITNIQRFFPHLSVDHFKAEDILALIFNDKKNTHGQLNFSLITNIGSCTFDHPIAAESIVSALEFYKKLK